MAHTIIRGNNTNRPVEDFNNRSVNQLIPSLVHLSDNNCRAILSNNAVGFGTRKFFTTKDLCDALNLRKDIIDKALLGESGRLLRRHMVGTGLRINLWSPRSVVILATLLHHRSDACRGISIMAAGHCSMKAKVAPTTAITEVIPVEAEIKVPHPIPVTAHLEDRAVQVPIQNEVFVNLQPGMVLRVAAM